MRANKILHKYWNNNQTKNNILRQFFFLVSESESVIVYDNNIANIMLSPFNQ